MSVALRRQRSFVVSSRLLRLFSKWPALPHSAAWAHWEHPRGHGVPVLLGCTIRVLPGSAMRALSTFSPLFVSQGPYPPFFTNMLDTRPIC